MLGASHSAQHLTGPGRSQPAPVYADSGITFGRRADGRGSGGCDTPETEGGGVLRWAFRGGGNVAGVRPSAGPAKERGPRIGAEPGRDAAWRAEREGRRPPQRM